MTDTSLELREQLLPEQAGRHIRLVSEQEASVDLESTEGQQLDDVASNQDLHLSSQSTPIFKIPGWPDHPLSLTQTRTARFVSVTLDIVLLVFALLFLALAAGALAVNGRGIGDKSGGLIEQATKLGPTVFPIVFAAMVGRALKTIGRFKSEKGIEVSTLWAFVSTKTVFDAFLLQWSAGAFSLPTILMGVLWAMSPAGGQASLRILYRTNQTLVSSTNIRYMDTGPLGLLYTYDVLLEGYDLEVNQTQDFPFSMSSSLAAALMQDVDTKSGPRDSWGNPKIPRLDILDQSAADEHGWVQVSQDPVVESFSSLFGLPLLGVPDHGTVEFGIESAYVSLGAVTIGQGEALESDWSFEATCPKCIKFVWDLLDGGLFQGRLARLLGPPWIQPNSSQLAQESFTSANIIRFVQYEFGTILSSEVTQVLVETHIVCEEGFCRATKIRPSTTDHRPENITAFDIWGVFALDLLRQANGNLSWSPTLLELFMNDTSTIPMYRANTYMTSQAVTWNNTNLAKREPETLSRRATLLLNLAIHLLYSYYGFAGALPSAESVDYGPPHTPAGGLSAAAAAYNVTNPGEWMNLFDPYVEKIVSGGAAFVAASTEASVTQKNTIYKADYAWVAVLVISSLALIFTGLVGMIMGLRTRGPDVFDPVMGLTYNNSSLGLPNPGSTLDANARAKLLRGMRVRLGDVAGEKSVGMVGVGRTPEVELLVQGRLYE